MMMCTRSGAAATLAFLLLSAGCQDDVAAPNGRLEISAAVVSTTPTSCAAISAANPLAASGEYKIATVGGATMLYCDMSFTPAREFLTLPAGPTNNYSNYGGATLNSGHFTRFSRIRVDPATLKINVNDMTHATMSGSAWHPNPYVAVTSTSYGTAMACSGGRTGMGSVDLHGTAFNLGPNPGSQFATWHGQGSITVVDPQLVTLRGGGYCAWASYVGAYNPFNNATWPIWALQLYLVSPMVNAPPVVTFSTTALEGQAVPFAVTDADGDALDVSWAFADGGFASSPDVTHAFADDGDYVVTVSANDGSSIVTESGTVHVANVAPVLTAIPAAELLIGEVYAAAGTFADPGVLDSFVASVDFGDSGPVPLALSGHAFAFSHAYSLAGTFTVTVTVADDDGGVGTTTATMLVLSPSQGSEQLETLVESVLQDGGIAPADAKPLLESVGGALDALAKGNNTAALGKLGAFDNKVTALLKSGRISQDDAEKLTGYSRKLQKSITG